MKSVKNLLPKHWPSQLQSHIGGKFVKAPGAAVYQNIYAATGEVIHEYEAAGQEQVDLAVTTAQKAQAEWAKWTPIERGRVLRKVANLLEERNDEFAALEAIDTARPLQETLEVDVVSAKDCFEYYGCLASAIGGEYLDMPGGNFAYTKREPLGVCAGIGAWNYPIQGMAWKMAPALICGNAIIFKPAESTPLTAIAMMDVLKDSGLPDGLVSILLGKGETGQLLSRHDSISKISFTGSVATGKKICAEAATNLKKVTMELGGKSPLIIFDDADLDDAVSAAMMANFYSNGEVCSNGTRVFVQEGILPEFQKRLIERTKRIKIGDPMDESTQMGALISNDHLEKVLGYVETGVNEGATLVYGGEKVTLEGGFENGAFMTPAIFTADKDDLTIVRQEIFGPVACLLSFKSEDEVVARANDTDFGLAAGVFTKDIQRGHRVIGQLKAGCTWINNYNLAPVELPWGGNKQSGIGRENGKAGIENWSQLKSVYVEMGKIECPYE